LRQTLCVWGQALSVPTSRPNQGRVVKAPAHQRVEHRYLGHESARLPGQLAVSRSARAVPTTVGVVQDPYDPKGKILVTVHRRVDVLEEELANRRIEPADYHTGRKCQAIFERAAGRSGPSWNLEPSRSDPVIARELSMIYGLDNARAVEALMLDIAKVIGIVGTRRLRSLLEGATFAEMAAARGKSGARAVHGVAQQFRWDLEDLTRAWAAKGVRKKGAAYVSREDAAPNPGPADAARAPDQRPPGQHAPVRALRDGGAHPPVAPAGGVDL
jgi:hypothetical protein